MNKPALVVTITGGLSLAGAVCGATAGALSFVASAALSPTNWVTSGPWSDILIAATFPGWVGAWFGAIAAPVAGWLLMRSVPLGRAFGGSMLGASVGGILGWVLQLTGDPILGGVLGATIGYVLAIVALRLWGQSSRAQAS